ncbi:MAG: hypothetical protein AAF151_21380 [Cyanobacteria bacterium J06656_5]
MASKYEQYYPTLGLAGGLLMVDYCLLWGRGTVIMLPTETCDSVRP